jgi:Amt family ammonium transporter
VGQSAFVEAERANVLIEDKREETLANSTGKPKFTKVVIITSQNRFEKLKNALDKIGITGLTAVKVLGYGIQKGSTEMYRGVEMESHLLPKVKVEMVISKLPVDQVVNVAKKVLYTGHYGDGKIFIYDVENVIKIRTGEEGYAALQDYPIV